MLRLLTIPISHYCEKARWALDRGGFSYLEERHVQVVHRIAARRAGGGMTVPVLVTDEGVIGDSAEIMRWVDARIAPESRLYPAEEPEREQVLALCRRFDDRLGPSARRLIYVHVFRAHEAMLAYNNQGVPAWEDRMIRRGWPLARAAVSRALEIRDGVEVQDEADVWRELDRVAELLRDGRPYLAGERFGAADLTFAALSAPVLLPPLYGVALPRPEEIGPQAEALVRRAREHPAGRFALRVVQEQRRARPEAVELAPAGFR